MPNPADQTLDDTDDAIAAGSGDSAQAQDDELAGGEASDAGGSAPSEVEEGAPQGEESANDAEELSIVLEGEEGAEPAPQEDATLPDWVRDLRKANREKERRIRDLERKLAVAAPPAPGIVEVGPEPTFDGCGYDADRYKQALLDWQKRDTEVKARQAEQQRAQEQEQAKWAKRLTEVDSAAKTLRIAGVQDAADAFESSLNEWQRGVVLGGPDNAEISAKLRHVIGTNPTVAKQLAAITDPVKYTFAIADLVPKMKTTSRKAAPPPDRRLNSGAVGTAVTDDALAKARARADKTGDRTEVARIMRARQQRAA